MSDHPGLRDRVADIAGSDARIEPLATLPVFYRVSGQRVVVVGGSEAAAWKAELLMAAGANVYAFAETFAPQFQALERRSGPGHLHLHRRAWVGGDLDGAVLAIGAISEERLAHAFVTAARDAGVPVNVVDRPEFCAFQFGAVVNRSPLIVAISTDGAAPVFAQAIRSWIEQLLPAGFKQWAEAAKTWRSEGERLGPTMSARRRFWERFTTYAIDHADRQPSVLDREKLIADSLGEDDRGSLTVLEVTSPDPELLTVRAVRALRTADVIVVGANVPAGVLEYARREAERHPATSLTAFAERIDKIEASIKLGKRVVAVFRSEPERSRTTAALIGQLEAAGIATLKIPAVSAEANGAPR